MAEPIERNGSRFYQRCAAIVQDPAAKKLFQDLAAWEDGHEAVFARMRVRLADKVVSGFDPSGEAELYLAAVAGRHVFSTSADPTPLFANLRTSVEFLDFALKFELDSILFFVGIKKAVPPGLSADEVEQLIQEEFGHVAYLEKARAAAAAP